MKTGFIELEVSRLVEAPWNYKQDNPEKYEKLKQNIARNGFLENIIVRELENGKFEVVNGNHRLKALKDLGITKVMTYNLGKVPEKVAKNIAIETNETKFGIDRLKFETLISDLLQSFNYDQLANDLPVDIDEFISEATKDIKMPVITEPENEPDEFIPDITEDPQNTENQETIYTTKIKTPQYIPKGEKPALNELFNDQKAQELINKINTLNLPEDLKTFLYYAAYRFVEFKFDKIAEFYAHADKQVQEIFEDLALVIIDFNDAIQKGFVKLTKGILKLIENDTE